MMTDTMRALFIVLVIVLVAGFMTGYLKSVFGKPVRGIMRVPQGKNRMPIDVFDDSPLRPYKYGQVFEATFEPDELTLTNAETGEKRTSTGAILFRGRPLGFADGANAFTAALMHLSEKYQKVTVSAVISTLDPEGRPVIELVLPNAKWFSRALSDKHRS